MAFQHNTIIDRFQLIVQAETGNMSSVGRIESLLIKDVMAILRASTQKDRPTDGQRAA
jgi:hypothetical protein